jgi:GntR family transcriptional regulator, transcriptional repressor for pyruvate dehydrogenase complex
MKIGLLTTDLRNLDMKGFELARRPVPMKTAEAISEMIRERSLKPGDQLPSQRELSSDLGVSRPSLREALSMLETLGIINVQPGRGVFVAEERAAAGQEATWRFSDRYSLREVFEMRRAIEGAAAALAMRHMDTACIAAIEAMCRETEAAAEARDVVRVAENDVRFHDLIFAHCGNRVFQDLHAQLRRLLIESQQVPMVERGRLVETGVEHRRIADAFRSGDAAAARSAMELHIQGAAHRAGIAL